MGIFTFSTMSPPTRRLFKFMDIRRFYLKLCLPAAAWPLIPMASLLARASFTLVNLVDSTNRSATIR
jgi:hypothetical protein